LYVDGLDFFAFGARQAAFAACARLGIPAVTAAPLGMGTAVLNFLPGHMTFEDYFGWGDKPEMEKALRFLVGLAPAGLHGGYLVDPSSINLKEQRGPSTIMGCELCAGAAATEALKILLKRGDVRRPRGLPVRRLPQQAGAHLASRRQPQPLQRLAMMLARRRPGTAMSKPQLTQRWNNPRTGALGAQRRQHPAVALRGAR
jgi:hypothetical protein